ncbi:methyl-accepting chemotaxis protein [uncultured Cohaesibacter sp.]|uniref:methyl-accepting chemotaxis protein n=1 Tax=uncultured Cohaesibacter sp. TaxID=1002546 RepID=UPI002AA5F00C|nr:methyl-accepting chemotaxis protein [uncultured Cohaesibacter sp.]
MEAQEVITNFSEIGLLVTQTVLKLASYLIYEAVPGIVSLGLVLLLVIVGVSFAVCVNRRMHAVHYAASLIRGVEEEEFCNKFREIEQKIHSRRDRESEKISRAWDEFSETLIQPRGNEGTAIRNSIRPQVFFNLDDLGFALTRWRFWQGLFVSLGLALTFIGLISALQQTGAALTAGGDMDSTQAALQGLLKIASAKFIMSLTGLVCSIIYSALYNWQLSRLGKSVERLANQLEKCLSFISLESIANDQLLAIKEQRDHTQKLNHELISAISTPLNNALEGSSRHVESMIGQLSHNLDGSMQAIGERIYQAAENMAGMAETLSSVSNRFEETMTRATAGMAAVTENLETIATNLSGASSSLTEATMPLAEAATNTANATRDIADSSITMVSSAQKTLESERDVVIRAAHAIEQQIATFEARAAAYDGELEKAFRSFRELISQSMSEVETHAESVHGQYAEALSTLQAVIQSAEAFIPESQRHALEIETS